MTKDGLCTYVIRQPGKKPGFTPINLHLSDYTNFKGLNFVALRIFAHWEVPLVPPAYSFVL